MTISTKTPQLENSQQANYERNYLFTHSQIIYSPIFWFLVVLITGKFNLRAPNN